jgi:hypothetical protein
MILLFWWLAWDAALILVNLVLTTANYLACKSSFELLGWEKRTLASDPLLGPFFGAFLGKAMLSDGYALALVVTIHAGLFLAGHLGFFIAQLEEERKTYLLQQDLESARIILRRMIRELVFLGLLLTALGVAIYWDVTLFRYRSIAAAYGIEDPLEATGLEGWPQQLQEYGGMFAWSLAALGGWGYIAVTALACFSLAYAFSKTCERSREWLAAFESPPPPQAEQEAYADFYGYDAYGQPVYDPHTPVVYDTNGQPVTEQTPPTPDTVTEPARYPYEEPPAYEPVFQTDPYPQVGNSALADPPSPQEPLFAGAEPEHPVPAGSPEHSGANGAHRSPVAPPPRHTPERRPPVRETPRDDRPVIGNSTGETVSLADALANPARYWVDPHTQEVWDVAYRRALMGADDQNG